MWERACLGEHLLRHPLQDGLEAACPDLTARAGHKTHKDTSTQMSQFGSCLEGVVILKIGSDPLPTTKVGKLTSWPSVLRKT